MTTEQKKNVLRKTDFTQRKRREVQNIVDSAKILYIIKNHLTKNPIYIKGYSQKYQIKISKIINGETIELIIPPGIEPENNLTIYTMLSKFVEIDLSYHKKVDNFIHQFQINGSNIAKTGRENIRFKLEKGDAFINNIKTSKNIIKATELTVPTSVKVIMHQFEPQLKNLADEVKVSPIDPGDPKHKFVQKTLKTYYVKETQDEKSYDPENDNFIDIRAYFSNDLSKAMRYYAGKKIRSEILTPIIYLTLDEKPIPLGIIHMISYTRPLELEKVLETIEISFKIVDSVRLANTVTIKKRQDVLDIGLGGAKILISDNELAGILVRQDGFIFDLYFRMQAPITLFTKIRNFHFNDEKDLILGVDFEGHSSRKEDVKRLQEIIMSIEKNYKQKL